MADANTVTAALATLTAQGWVPTGNRQYAGNPIATIDAGFFGVVANTGADMTSKVTLAVNAAIVLGMELIWPVGDIRIYSMIPVVPATKTAYTDHTGTVNYGFPIRWRGFGASLSRIIQMTPSIPAFKFYEASGVALNLQFRDFSVFNNTASINDVYQTGIEIGGGTSGYTGGMVYIHNVGGWNLYSVFRCDDMTGVFVSGQPFYLRARYYMEGGYNADQYTFRDFNGGGPVIRDIPCTATNTSGTINGISSTVTQYLLPGMAATFAGCAADTVVQTVNSTSITVLPVPTAGGATALTFHTAALLATQATNAAGLYSGTGMATVANAQGWANRTRSGNPSVVTFDNVLWNDARGLMEDYGQGYTVNMRQIYVERPQKIYTGNSSALHVDGVFVSQPQSLYQSAFNTTNPNIRGYIRNVVTDGAQNTFYTVNLGNLTSNNGPEFTVENVFDYVGGIYGNSLRPVTKVGGGIAGSNYWIETGSNTPTIDWIGCDGIKRACTANVTFQNPGSIYPADNREITMEVTSDAAGRTVSYGSAWVNADGTAIATSAASTGAGQIYIAKFRKLPGVNRMKLLNAPAWG